MNIILPFLVHRVVSVAVGVAWGIFVTQYVWPISARTKLRKGLSVLWFRMALIWKRDPLLSTIEYDISFMFGMFGNEP